MQSTYLITYMISVIVWCIMLIHYLYKINLEERHTPHKYSYVMISIPLAPLMIIAVIISTPKWIGEKIGNKNTTKK